MENKIKTETNERVFVSCVSHLVIVISFVANCFLVQMCEKMLKNSSKFVSYQNTTGDQRS